MATTINADTSVGGAVVTGDASGVLGLQAAGNTALTLNSSRAIGVGASPDYGSSGQVLTSAGSSAAPTWATPATGAMTLLATVNATSGTYVTFNGYFTSAYDVYLVTGSNFFVDNAYVAGYLQSQIAIASTYQTASNYRYVVTSNGSDNTTTSVYAGTTSTYILMNSRTDLYRGNAFSFYIYNPLTTNESKSLAWTLLGRDGSNNLTQNIGVGSFTGSPAALTGIRFFWSGGDFQSGKFQLYGLKNS